MMKSRITIRINDKEQIFLERYAVKHRISKSEALRRGINALYEAAIRTEQSQP